MKEILKNQLNLTTQQKMLLEVGMPLDQILDITPETLKILLNSSAGLRPSRYNYKEITNNAPSKTHQILRS